MADHIDQSPLFPGVTFAGAVSLGGDCEPAHSLRLNGRYVVHGLFDWLVTPLDSIARILADDGVSLGRAFTVVHEGTSVRCGVYDVLYHHEFPRQEGGRVSFDIEAIERCRAKMLHKMASFLDLCEGDGPVLFIRLGIATNLDWDRLGPRGEAPKASDLNGLVDALARRFPGLDFRVLCIQPIAEAAVAPDSALDPRVVALFLSDTGRASGGWMVEEETWSQLLARVDFASLAVFGEGLGEALHWSGEDQSSSPAPTAGERPAAVEAGPLRTHPDAEARLNAALAAQAAGQLDLALARVQAVLREPNLAPRLRHQAAGVLSACGRGEEAVAALRRAAEDAPGLSGVAADLAAALEAAQRPLEALAWWRQAVGADQLSQVAYTRLACLEDIHGDPERAFETLDAMLTRGVGSASLAHQYGLRLWRSGRAHHAVRTFAIAYAHGWRERGFLRDYLDLLTGEARYGEVLETIEALGREDPAALDWPVHSGRAKLSLQCPRETEITIAERRSASAQWLDTAGLLDVIRSAMRARRPFAFVRLGDGEARFLVASRLGQAGRVTSREAAAIGEVVWENWFGEPLSAVSPSELDALSAAYTRAVRAADVVGASDPARLRQDTGHYGYLALQEQWLRDVFDAHSEVFWTSALIPADLHRASPFLRDVLAGQDVMGVISPHPGLADALKAHLGIAKVMGWVIPAEGRLPTAGETRAAGRHFPTIYQRILQDLAVPRPGCVFLVAGGLLGKLYCHRIKQLGGIALDIGSLADAWMGFETRPGQFGDVQALPPATARDGSAAKPPTYVCLSIGKTSSMALAAALRDTVAPDVAHLHYLGPRAIAMKRHDPEPMLDLALLMAARLEDPARRFRIVTSVRDPIARALSQAFHNAADHLAKTGEDIVRDQSAFVAWYEGKFLQELTTEWFDDTFGSTFGFDFREHPFDRERRSLRWESGRLRLVVLRVEDAAAGKEAELGWLSDREAVPLPVVNDAASTTHALAYKAFAESFVAPKAWLDAYYETGAIRHFYTQDERAAFRVRWGAGR